MFVINEVSLSKVILNSFYVYDYVLKWNSNTLE